MTEIELEQAIRDYITTLYKACYIGWLRVEKLNPGYKMSIGVPSYMFPTTTAGDWATDEEFLNYIYEDLRIRNYMRVYFYKVHRTTRNEEDGRSSEQPGIPQRPTCDPNYTDYVGINPIDPIIVYPDPEPEPIIPIKYGALYNWYTASKDGGTGVGSIAPEGWHVPSQVEFENFIAYLLTLVEYDNLASALIDLGFNVAYGGKRLSTFTSTGEFSGIDTESFYLSYSGEIYLPGYYNYIELSINSGDGNVSDYSEISDAGSSIRLIKDDSVDTGTVTDIDSNVYPTVKIGDQVWMAANLAVTKFNDGTPIPNITDNIAWAALTTGAMCYYNNDITNK